MQTDVQSLIEEELAFACCADDEEISFIQVEQEDSSTINIYFANVDVLAQEVVDNYWKISPFAWKYKGKHIYFQCKKNHLFLDPTKPISECELEEKYRLIAHE